VALDGDRHLERIQWLDSATGVVETHGIRHVFMMTGAVPNTGWLDGCLALDGRGFLKTGPDLSPEDLTTGGWPLARPPYLLETNRPGVFAVGDVRSGNIKRGVRRRRRIDCRRLCSSGASSIRAVINAG
jgi:thioredoxin reductase (NADPH)